MPLKPSLKKRLAGADMTRYIDANAIVIEEILLNNHKILKVNESLLLSTEFSRNIEVVKGFLNEIIETAPTCDVVPKSEVEYWKEEANCYQTLWASNCVDFNIAIRDVASKIIREIREAIFAHGTKYAIKKLASIEKKYMNGE